jgi:hypothetical protein
VRHGGHEEIRTEFKSENLKGTDYFGVIGIDGRIILKRILKEYTVRVCSV